MRTAIALLLLVLAVSARAGGEEDHYARAQREAAQASADIDRGAAQFEAATPEPAISARIEQAKACTRESDASIRCQREIGRQVGVIDQRALYLAGADKVSCQHQLAAFQRCQKTGKCPVDPYAPTRFQPYTPASAP